MTARAAPVAASCTPAVAATITASVAASVSVNTVPARATPIAAISGEVATFATLVALDASAPVTAPSVTTASVPVEAVTVAAVFGLGPFNDHTTTVQVLAVLGPHCVFSVTLIVKFQESEIGTKSSIL